MGSPPPVDACRPATADDVARIEVLATEAIAELAAGRGGAVWRRTQARQGPLAPGLLADLGATDRQVVVGTLDEVVVGFGIARTEVLADGGVLGVVESLYTEPAAREVGLGERMMDDLLDWCRSQGCFGVDSLALPGDRHTKNFFESFGLVARAITVHRSLS